MEVSWRGGVIGPLGRCLSRGEGVNPLLTNFYFEKFQLHIIDGALLDIGGSLLAVNGTI